MLLKVILSNYHSNIIVNETLLNTEITGIFDNSKDVITGSLFVAIDGYKLSGVAFIEEALLKGASIIVLSLDHEEEFKNNINLKNKVIFVENTRVFLAQSVFLFYQNELPQNIFTVTGTNGKSSICNFISQFLNGLNINNSVIGSLGIFINGKKQIDTITTPSPVVLGKYLNLSKKNNINYSAMESSSHGIAQDRMLGLTFEVIGFTNLTHDHLDYHKDMEDYYQTKRKLFFNYGCKTAVINSDDSYGAKLKSECLAAGINVIDYGFKAQSFKILNIENKDGGYQEVTFNYNKNNYTIILNLIGDFQVYNVICAIAMMVAKGFEITEIIKICESLQALDGRMNVIKEIKDFTVIVDFAHTPNAIEVALRAIKDNNFKKIKILFGCGGDRDNSKRPIMGEIAAKNADVVYISDDNPRFEDATKIREQVVAGVQKVILENTKVGNNKTVEYYSISDRKEAIYEAIKNMQAKEVLLIAGKGNEDYQIVKDKILKIKDYQTALEAYLHYHGS